MIQPYPRDKHIRRQYKNNGSGWRMLPPVSAADIASIVRRALENRISGED
jgi:hypothetical protein